LRQARSRVGFKNDHWGILLRGIVRRFPLYRLAPPELQAILLDYDWSTARLHALDLPVGDVAVADLRWQLDLRWWRFEDRFFAVTPNEVRADPVRYEKQWQRTLAADLAYPIHLRESAPGRWTIVDGVHRLLKAEVTCVATLRAMRVPDDVLATIAE